MKQINYFLTRIGVRIFLTRLSVFYPAFRYYKIH
jgi:hypothetical protein